MTADGPEWLSDTTDSEIRTVRVQLHDGLRKGQTLFRKLLVPESIEREDRLDKLLNMFDQVTLNALISLFYAVQQVLFSSGEKVFDSEEKSRRFLVQDIPEILTREISSFVNNIFNPVDTAFPGSPRVLTDFFEQWLDTVQLALKERAGPEWKDFRDYSPSEIAARKRWREEIARIHSDFDDSLKAGAAADQAIESAQVAARAADAARAAAGETAEIRLGSHFNAIASRERWLSLGWTAATIGCVVAVVWVGLVIVSNAALGQDWKKTIFHVVLVLPILGLATYTANVSKYHRLMERWATTAYAQIRTVGAYSELLASSDAREELIMILGRTVFGTPIFADDMKSEQISTLPPDLIDALKEIARNLAPKKD